MTEHPLSVRQNDAGFMLVELLVSLTLMVLIGGLLVQVMSFSRHALNFLDRANSHYPLAAAQNYLRDIVYEMHAPELTATGNQSQFGVFGNAEHLVVTTEHAPMGIFQGIYRIEVSPTPNAQGGIDLTAVQELLRPVGAGPKFVSTLVPNISGVRFAYLKPNSDAGKNEWQNAWMDGIPKLISIQVWFPKGDTRVWHQMMVPLAASATFGTRCPLRLNCD